MSFAYSKCIAIKDENKVAFGAGYYVDAAATDQLKAGELHVPPRSRAGHDAGHPGADEVFYIAQGVATFVFPESGERETVAQGCYIFMPRGVAHEVHNEGDEPVKALYFGIVK